MKLAKAKTIDLQVLEICCYLEGNFYMIGRIEFVLGVILASTILGVFFLFTACANLPDPVDIEFIPTHTKESTSTATQEHTSTAIPTEVLTPTSTEEPALTPTQDPIIELQAILTQGLEDISLDEDKWIIDGQKVDGVEFVKTEFGGILFDNSNDIVYAIVDSGIPYRLDLKLKLGRELKGEYWEEKSVFEKVDKLDDILDQIPLKDGAITGSSDGLTLLWRRLIVFFLKAEHYDLRLFVEIDEDRYLLFVDIGWEDRVSGEDRIQRLKLQPSRYLEVNNYVRVLKECETEELCDPILSVIHYARGYGDGKGEKGYETIVENFNKLMYEEQEGIDWLKLIAELQLFVWGEADRSTDTHYLDELIFLTYITKNDDFDFINNFGN